MVMASLLSLQASIMDIRLNSMQHSLLVGNKYVSSAQLGSSLAPNTQVGFPSTGDPYGHPTQFTPHNRLYTTTGVKLGDFVLKMLLSVSWVRIQSAFSLKIVF
jgi:hypothetical protein